MDGWVTIAAEMLEHLSGFVLVGGDVTANFPAVLGLYGKGNEPNLPIFTAEGLRLL
jgi:hypothetical protein